MKALSIKQPWASLIAHGIKDIENRTWKTKIRGSIFIHATAKGTDADFTISQTAELFINGIWNPETGLKSELFHCSSIIGEIDIVDCVINHPSIWAEQTEGVLSGNKFIYKDKPIYNWVLANPVLYEKPILNVKGKLSFWHFEGCNHSNCALSGGLIECMNCGIKNY